MKGDTCQFHYEPCDNPIQGEGKYCPIHYYGRPQPRRRLCPTCMGSGVVPRIEQAP